MVYQVEKTKRDYDKTKQELAKSLDQAGFEKAEIFEEIFLKEKELSQQNLMES